MLLTLDPYSQLEHKLTVNNVSGEDEAEYTIVFREDVKTSARLYVKGEQRQSNVIYFSSCV